MSTVNKLYDTQIELLGTTLTNPIIPASGTFGFGYEFSEYYDINCLGSMSLKGTTLEARYGNPLPRIAECPAGLINAIGLQNPGVDKVISKEIPRLAEVYSKPVIANVGGHSFFEYVETVRRFNDVEKVFAVELNISCPNVKGGGMAFGTNPETVETLVKEIKKVSTKPIIVKLSPNVTDVTVLAKAAENGGADALSLINTLVGMRIDLRTARPIISVKSGGYSGPGVFPVAVNMVYKVREKTTLPIIGMGGISSAEDVIEMMYAGANAVMVGSANLINPYASKEIVDALPTAMDKYGINKLSDIIGRSHNV